MTAPTPQVRDLAEAIVKALTLPYPADADAGARRTDVMRDRVAAVLGNLDYLLDGDDSGVATALRSLDSVPDRFPADYPERAAPPVEVV